MNTQIIAAIVTVIIGALSQTGYSFFWKWYSKKYLKTTAAVAVSFDKTYLYSALIAAFITIMSTPLFFIPGALPLAVIGSIGLVYVAVSGFSVGFTANLLINKPVTYMVKRIQSYEAACAAAPKTATAAASATKLSLPNSIKSKLTVIGAILLLVVLISGASVYAVSVYSQSIHSTGTLRAYGVQVADLNGNTQTSINWGLLEPGNTYNVTLLLTNTGNGNVTYAIYATNWMPPTASDFMTLSTSYAGVPLQPGVALQVRFMLTVSPVITGITDFSNEIIINAVPYPLPSLHQP